MIGPGFFAVIEVTAAERAADRPGDEVVSDPDVVMDRAVDVPVAPEVVWPWLVQLGKNRSGWYLTRRVERLIPARNRAIRRIDPQWQSLAVGDVVPDWGGKHETFEVLALDPGASIVYGSQRGKTKLTWTITVVPTVTGTRIFFRLRLAPIKRPWLANSVGDFFDALTIRGMANGLRERLADTR
ncbi:MAG TPA: hypothetical protein VFE15_10310 [Marmoricola sp.]|nr:hypothetical protein [Marmoricola sp.]